MGFNSSVWEGEERRQKINKIKHIVLWRKVKQRKGCVFGVCPSKEDLL